MFKKGSRTITIELVKETTKLQCEVSTDNGEKT